MHKRKMNSRFTATLLAILCATPLFVLFSITGKAAVAVERPDYLTFEYQQVGASEEEAVRLACIRAVKATVGYILFSEYALQGRDLLEPYLQKNWPRFVASSYVLEKRASRDGYGVRIRVQTMPEVLTRDLREKRFLYLPEQNPSYFVFAGEITDGTPTSATLARELLTEKLESHGIRVLKDGITCPSPLTDVLSCPAVFDAARIAALRRGAHIMVAARCESKKVSESPVLYDTMISYETKLKLQIIRTDDGSALATAECVARGADKDPETARREAIKNAIEIASETMGSEVQQFWTLALREKGTFQLLFSDLNLEELSLVASYLESTLGAGTKALVRSYYGNVAVLSLVTPRDYSALERALLDFTAFQLRVADRNGYRITVNVKH